jgi:hypothetical protein
MDDTTDVITAAEFDQALALTRRIGAIAERRLPLWLAATGHPDQDANSAYFTGLDSDGEIHLHHSGYEREDNRDWYLPVDILLAQDYEQAAAAVIAERAAKAKAAAAEKAEKEVAARERADRAAYERLRDRFEHAEGGHS